MRAIFSGDVFQLPNCGCYANSGATFGNQYEDLQKININKKHMNNFVFSWQTGLSECHHGLCVALYFINQHHGSNLQTYAPLRQRQNGHHVAEDNFKCVFLIENASVEPDFTEFCLWDWNDNKPSLVQVIVRHHSDGLIYCCLYVSFHLDK